VVIFIIHVPGGLWISATESATRFKAVFVTDFVRGKL
jgi:hypothetical protein